MDITFYDTDILGLTSALAQPAPGLTRSQLVALFFLALPVAGPVAYLVITSLDLREDVAAIRERKPYVCKLLKALCHAILFLKLLLAHA